MAAFTSKASGNLSAGGQTTWNEAGVPGSGDTFTTAAAHHITIDVNTTVGTSPNDTTTYVVDINGPLTIAPGVTFTVKGNWVDVLATVTMAAGSSIVFDAAASGGTPTYTINSVLSTWLINGTSGSHCAISAVAGRVFVFYQTNNFPAPAFTYCDFTRMTATTWDLHDTSATSFSLTNCTFTSCGKPDIASGSTSCSCTVTGNTFTSGTGTEDIQLSFTGAHTSGTRTFSGNVGTGYITYASLGFTIQNNVGFNWAANAAASTHATRSNNFWRFDGGSNGGNGALSPSSMSDEYFYLTNELGNPHFVEAHATSADTTVSGCIFEYDGPHVGETGDCIFPRCSAGRKVTVQNCIVLPSSRAGNAYTSGSLGTHYATDANVTAEYIHNTIYNSTNGSVLAGIDISEAGNGHANEVTILKSNLFWSVSGDPGMKVTRLVGTVNAVLTAAGADYNWGWHQAAGDNGRGYNDFAGNLNLWDGSAATTGDADEAGVDDNGGNGDPQFVDSTRNLAKWDLSLGGAGTSAAAITRLKASPAANVALLLAYVRGGFAPTNSLLRNAGHDSVTIGAVEGVFGGHSLFGGPVNGGLINRGLIA